MPYVLAEFGLTVGQLVSGNQRFDFVFRKSVARSTWNGAAQFGRKTDWVFAIPQRAGELPLRATPAFENDRRKPRLSLIGWDGIPAAQRCDNLRGT
jgi:hypothetical protein